MFDTPNAVSALAEDKFSFKVKETSLFKSASNLKPLTKEAFGEGDGTIIKVSPPMISDKETAERIASTTESGGAMVTMFTSSNFIIMILLAGSMEHLWSLIRAMQMIVLSVLVLIKLPAHSFQFM